MSGKPLNLFFVCLFSILLLAGWFYLCDDVMSAQAGSTIRYVAPLGQCGSNTPCYAQVQAAVDAAVD